MQQNSSESVIRRFFSGMAEYTFQTELGVVDPPLVEYVAELLVRFVRSDTIFHMRSTSGKRISDITEMKSEADSRVGEAKREAHRHIGDFTLFWTGVYPEALSNLQHSQKKDHLLNYPQEGKQAYHIASRIPGGKTHADSDVLHRLSDQFDLCVYGLGEVRREWERRDDDLSIEPLWLN